MSAATAQQPQVVVEPMEVPHNVCGRMTGLTLFTPIRKRWLPLRLVKERQVVEMRLRWPIFRRQTL